MLRFGSGWPVLGGLLRSGRCGFSAQQRFTLVPTTPQSSKSFFKNVYGVKMDKHILPYNIYNFGWKLQQMKEYRKRIPNYVVILVNKVLDDADKNKDIEPSQDLMDKYYKICTYCKVKYFKEYTQIEGLYRVKLNQIQQVKQDGQPALQSIETLESDSDLEGSQLSGELAPESVSSLLINKKPSRKLNLQLYSVQVDMLSEPPLMLSYQTQIRMKYLIQTYKAFFPNFNRDGFLLFNCSQAVKHTYIMAQQMSTQNYKPKEVQAILEEDNLEMKMELIQSLMNKTLDWKNVYRTIEKSAETNIKNKKYFQYYSEILKIAKQNIEGKKGKQVFLDRVTQQFLDKKPPKEIKEVFEQEKEKYMLMEESSSESPVVKKYLQDLSKIPYSIKSEELFDLEFAQKALDEEHYGMKDVKDAIIQIIAVGKLKGSLKGKIFCLIGGPGLGKTTIAKSIAKALGRKFYNISLGGVTDSSVLKGHRRTYVAAYAGKIIQALKQCQTNNPVILLDQIDKMGSGSQGDPRSQLLQILDPTQNSSFVDNYIDLPIDLSNVLFICSANYQRNISKPLLDRLQKIRLSSYTDDQKKQIFKRHLLRRAIDKTGVHQYQFNLAPNVVDALIYEYSMGEPGVRRMEKNIQKILERAAYKIVEQEEPLPIQITTDNLRDYLGNSYFRHKDHSTIGVGVAISLGGGDYGSRLTYIESFKKNFAGKNVGKRAVMFTGSLGDVFKQAMNISYTYTRNFLQDKLGNKFLHQNQVHIHAPDGASKKDGSTDSLTISASLVSLALQKQVKKGIAMTGQLTLHGRILRTHGIKQKVLLARRERINNLIIPFQNQSDVEMLPAYIKEGITFHFVREFEQVYKLLFETAQVTIDQVQTQAVPLKRVEAIL